MQGKGNLQKESLIIKDRNDPKSNQDWLNGVLLWQLSKFLFLFFSLLDKSPCSSTGLRF
jgi:hypothetical protein